MRITEAKIRSIIKEEIKNVLNEGADREQASQLISAMNQINSDYDSTRIGEKVPSYKQDADIFMIKDFINEFVSGQDIDRYLNKLKELLSIQKLNVIFSTDDDSEDGYLTSIDF